MPYPWSHLADPKFLVLLALVSGTPVSFFMSNPQLWPLSSGLNNQSNIFLHVIAADQGGRGTSHFMKNTKRQLGLLGKKCIFFFPPGLEVG